MNHPYIDIDAVRSLVIGYMLNTLTPSPYISAHTGIDLPKLHGFIQGKSGLTGLELDRLCAHFNVALTRFILTTLPIYHYQKAVKVLSPENLARMSHQMVRA